MGIFSNIRCNKCFGRTKPEEPPAVLQSSPTQIYPASPSPVPSYTPFSPIKKTPKPVQQLNLDNATTRSRTATTSSENTSPEKFDTALSEPGQLASSSGSAPANHVVPAENERSDTIETEILQKAVDMLNSIKEDEDDAAAKDNGAKPESTRDVSMAHILHHFFDLCCKKHFFTINGHVFFCVEDSMHSYRRDNSGEIKVANDTFILQNDSRKVSDVYTMDRKQLGEGAYGSVTTGKHKTLHTTRAIKRMGKKHLRNIPRFRTEISIMRTLDHPNIIRLFETFEDSQSIYLVLELCTGGELFDRIIASGHFGERECAMIMRQALSAINYLHNNGIVHRDLKPENFIFVDEERDAPLKLIDFGLATRFDNQTMMKTKAGTPYYVAPQVLEGRYDHCCDIWSLGVIMYVLLCGYPPFYGDSDEAVLKRVKSGYYTFPHSDWKNVSPDATGLIRLMLAHHPFKRPSAAQLLTTNWIRDSAPNSVPTDAKQLINAFSRFQAHTRFKKLALRAIARQLDDRSIQKLKNAFMSMDANGDGTLTVQEIRSVLIAQGVDSEQLTELVDAVDSDQSGQVDYTEFIAATLQRKDYIREDLCWRAFSEFGSDLIILE